MRLAQDRTQVGVRTVTNYAYDAANQLVTTTEGTAVTTYTFDANGNQRSEETITGARTTYTWDPRNLLTNYGAPTGQIATYTHRYDDLRATLDPGDAEATRLVWDPLGTSDYVDVLAETDAAEALVREYWRGARLAVFKSPSTKGAYLFDHLGNTEGVLNSAQNFAVGYLYSAWGEGLKTTGALAQAWQFGGDWGAWREAISADLWMRARVMQPGRGVFLSHGLQPEDVSSFGYADNRPTARIDPDGRSAAVPLFPLPPPPLLWPPTFANALCKPVYAILPPMPPRTPPFPGWPPIFANCSAYWNLCVAGGSNAPWACNSYWACMASGNTPAANCARQCLQAQWGPGGVTGPLFPTLSCWDHYCIHIRCFRACGFSSIWPFNWTLYCVQCGPWVFPYPYAPIPAPAPGPIAPGPAPVCPPAAPPGTLRILPWASPGRPAPPCGTAYV